MIHERDRILYNGRSSTIESIASEKDTSEEASRVHLMVEIGGILYLVIEYGMKI